MCCVLFFLSWSTSWPLSKCPNFKTVVVKLVGRAVHSDADFCQVWVKILFCVSCACSIRLNKEEQDDFEGPSLWVDSEVQPRIVSLCKSHHFSPLDVVICEFFATCVNAPRLVCQRLAVNHFVLQREVCKLLNQFSWIGASDYL